VDEAESAVRAMLSWISALDPVRQAVLVNMAFNLGVEGLLDFHKMLAAVEHHQYGQASDEMMDSLWAAQVKGRAAELAAMMRTGSWVL
jgi:lysozyme